MVEDPPDVYDQFPRPSSEDIMQTPDAVRLAMAWEVYHQVGRKQGPSPFVTWLMEKHDLVVVQGPKKGQETPYLECPECHRLFTSLHRLPNGQVFLCYRCRRDVQQAAGLCGLCGKAEPDRSLKHLSESPEGGYCNISCYTTMRFCLQGETAYKVSQG